MVRTRVLLVDDNPAILQQVAQLLTGEFEVVDLLDSGDGVLDAVAGHRPDVVILDVTLPRTTGFELASQIVSAGLSPKIMFLTVHNDPDYVRAAFAAGASGYVVKMRMAVDLIPALKVVLGGATFVSPDPGLSVIDRNERPS